ncbi:MAG: gliding motility-associated C-terminal domain-containing protein [Janthinobacterium lividum]
MLLGLLTSWSAAAQAEYNQWHFGFHTALQFPGGAAAPTFLTGSQLNSGEACAAIADSRGQLLFYTNGIQAWNKLHQPLANGLALGGYAGASSVTPNSATQGAAIIAKPGSSSEYYIFTVDAAENDLRTGLNYSLVDMSRQAGLGEVVAKAVHVPLAIGDGRLTEKLVIVRHANQRDIWVLVHGWNNNLFYAFLVTATGISATPVVSGGGLVQQGGIGFADPPNWNAIGAMKVSPNGRRLALVQFRSAPVELFDFNAGTGIVSQPQQLTSVYTYSNYGVEFSPNSKLLYTTSAQGLTQYDLLTGQPTSLSSASGFGALQLGPDGKIYQVDLYEKLRLNIVQQPDQPGRACAYQPAGLILPLGMNTQLGLPTVLVSPPVSPTPLVSFGVVGTQVCVGEPSLFTAAVYPAMPTATVSWEFGEPAAGSANTAVGLGAQHQYTKAGTYQVTMQVTTLSGQVYTYAQPVTILARLATQLRVSSPPCEGQAVTLSVYPALPPGTLYTWQDGSGQYFPTYLPTFTVTRSGVYWVDIDSPQLCPQRDSIRLTLAPTPGVSLGPDRPIGCEEIITLDASVPIAGSSYRWQDGSTRAQYRALLPGRYSVSVLTPAGCTIQAAVTLRATAGCEVSLPTIITPNGDNLNDKLVVRGVAAGTVALAVYNRWGRVVYQQTGYHNDWDAAGQADGLYYCLVTTETGRHYKSWVEVLR